MNEFKTVLKNTKYGKVCGLVNIPGELMILMISYCRYVIHQTLEAQ